jgi:hypothetical protein
VLADDPAVRFGTAGEFVEALASAFDVMPDLRSSAAVTPSPRPIEMAIDIDVAVDSDPVGDAPLRPAVESPMPVLPPVTPFEISDAPSIGVTMAPRSAVEPPRFPWIALIAASVACLAAGGLLGFKWGFSRGADARIVSELASVTAPPPAKDTPAPPVQSPAVSPAPLKVEAPAIGAAPPQTAATGSRRSPAVTKASAGSLEVDSRPRGARVTVDGRRVGQTPLKVSAMSPGDHRVLIELTGHRRVTSTVKVTAGEQTRLAVSLEPASSDTSGSNARKRN